MSESELARLQGRFLQGLLENGQDCEADILPTPGADTGRRMDIYRNAYRYRLLEALAESYPAVHTLLGDERFDELGQAYILARPSRYRSIRWFGDGLGDFLDQHPAFKDWPVVAEMARFEWTLRAAFDAADRDALGLEQLRALQPEAWVGLGLEFHPSLQLLDLRWNVPRLWGAIDADEPPIAPEQNDYAIVWAVWRKGLQTLYRSLEVDEAWMLGEMQRGGAFGAVCAGLTEWVDEFNAPQRAAGLLSQWVGEGLVCTLRIPDGPSAFLPGGR